MYEMGTNGMICSVSIFDCHLTSSGAFDSGFVELNAWLLHAKEGWTDALQRSNAAVFSSS
jgi:hypothetical protein